MNLAQKREALLKVSESVREFQSIAGLRADGVLGPITEDAMSKTDGGVAVAGRGAKKPWASKGIIAAGLTTVLAILGLFGVDFAAGLESDEEMTALLVDLVYYALLLVGGIGAAYGRWRAKDKIVI